MAGLLKSAFYLIAFGGGGYLLMNLAPSDDQIKRDMMEKKNAYTYYDPGHAKTADKFTNVLLAAATSKKTVYGSKTATEQKLLDRAKETD